LGEEIRQSVELSSAGRRNALLPLSEIRPFRNGWKCFEAPGVEPVFLDQKQAIDYAKNRACFRSGEIRILDSTGNVERMVHFTERTEKCELPNFIRLQEQDQHPHCHC
jgi:hypothetical protein